MKVVVLAGGRGDRMGAATAARPKPMVEVGGKPLLWHIVQHYRHFGFSDFVIAAGYRGEVICEYFARNEPEFRVQVVDTGEGTATAGRLARLARLLEGEAFMMTWGDAVCDVDLARLLSFHRQHGRLATVTAVHPPVRFGKLTMAADQVVELTQHGRDPTRWVNGAYFVLEPDVLDWHMDDRTSWEDGPMTDLIHAGELMAYRHVGFWQCMDYAHERDGLERWWKSGQAPWVLWDAPACC